MLINVGEVLPTEMPPTLERWPPAGCRGGVPPAPHVVLSERESLLFRFRKFPPAHVTLSIFGSMLNL